MFRLTEFYLKRKYIYLLLTASLLLLACFKKIDTLFETFLKLIQQLKNLSFFKDKVVLHISNCSDLTTDISFHLL